MIRIRADDKLFMISNKTLNNNKFNPFYKVINDNFNHPLIYKNIDSNNNITLYVDSDPDIVQQIITKMRKTNNLFEDSQTDDNNINQEKEKVDVLHIKAENDILNNQKTSDFADFENNVSKSIASIVKSKRHIKSKIIDINK
jgi:hypothetical protein